MKTKRIKTYEEALERLGIKHFDESGLTPDEVAYKKLKIITEALNDGWIADWNDSDQRKYAPWFDTSSVFVFNVAYYYYSHANAGYAYRLCFRDSETSEYAGRTFIDLYKAFIL